MDQAQEFYNYEGIVCWKKNSDNINFINNAGFIIYVVTSLSGFAFLTNWILWYTVNIGAQSGVANSSYWFQRWLQDHLWDNKTENIWKVDCLKCCGNEVTLLWYTLSKYGKFPHLQLEHWIIKANRYKRLLGIYLFNLSNYSSKNLQT